jgi:N-acetyltransferase 10
LIQISENISVILKNEFLSRQTANDLTGEHSCIMLKVLRGQLEDTVPVDNQWLQAFWLDFRRRFISLLGFQFRKMSPALALAVLHNKSVSESHTGIHFFKNVCDRK